MIHNRVHVISEDQARQFNQAALSVLQRVGMRVLSDTLLHLCEEYGWLVDHTQGLVRFQTEKVMEVTQWDRDHAQARPDPEMEDSALDYVSADVCPDPTVPASFGCSYGEACFFLYDWQDRRLIAAGRPEVEAMVRLGDALPQVRSISLPFLNQQIDQRLEAIEACEILLTNTSKPSAGGIRMGWQVPYFIEIARIVEERTGQKDRFLQAGGCLTSPLTLGRRTAEIVEQFVAHGYRRTGFSSMPVAGANAPVTPEGTVVMGVAELLGGWMIAKAVGPDEHPGVGMIISGIMDPKTGRASFGAPEACLQDLAVFETFMTCYGVPVGLDSAGSYSEGRVPGMMTLFEKCFKQTTFGVAAGLGLHLGTIDCARTFSPTQAMLELDTQEWMWRFFRGLSVSPQTLAEEVIADIGAGESKSFLMHDHTLVHWRELFTPRFWDRRCWSDPDTEHGRDQGVLQKADAAWREILANAPPPQVDEELVEQVRRVVEKAKTDLGV